MNNIIENIGLIQPRYIQSYLNYLGWKQNYVYPNNKAIQYVSSDYNYSATIPIDPTLFDYDRLLLDSLNNIAEYSETQIESIILKLLYPSFDLMKWRVSDSSTHLGTIPFDMLPTLIASIKDTFASALNDILNPNILHVKLYNKEVSKTLSECQFGQTQFGSYIVNVLCPLGQHQLSFLSDDFSDKPILRKANEKILSSISRIHNDLKKGNKNKIDEELEQHIYSVNFLKALTNIYQQSKDTDLNIIADWCKDLPVPDNIPNCVTIEHKYTEDIGIIVEKHSLPEISEELKSFYGKIASIESEPEVDNRKLVKVKIATIGENNKEISLYANLDYEEYFKHVEDAFSKGLNIKISGRYIYNSKKKQVEDPIMTVLD